MAVPLSMGIALASGAPIVAGLLAAAHRDHAGFGAIHAWRAGYEKLGGVVDLDQSHPAWGQVDASAA